MPFKSAYAALGRRPVDIPKSWYGLYTALPGRFIAVMDDARNVSDGGILLTEGAKYRPDVATVIAAGEGVGLNPGDVVVVRPYDGLRQYKENEAGSKLQLRFYGVGRASDYDGSERIPWYESALAVMEGDRLIPTHGAVTIKRKREWPEGLECPEGVKLWGNCGVVVEGGNSRWSEGETVYFTPHMDDALVQFEFTSESDLWYVPSESLLPCLIEH